MQTNIPNNALPTNLSNPNKIGTTYTTNILYPKLGPASVNNYIRITAHILRDIASTIKIVENVKDYNRKYNTKVSVIKQPEAWLKEQIQFKPILAHKDEYSRVFISGLSEFNDPAPIKTTQSYPLSDARTFVTQPRASRSAPRTTSTSGQRFSSRASIVAIGTNLSAISALEDSNINHLNLLNGKVTSDNISVNNLIKRDSSSFENAVKDGDVIKFHKADLDKILEDQKQVYNLANLMHGFSQPNTVMEDLYNKKIVSQKGSVIKEEILNSRNLPLRIVKSLEEGTHISDEKLEDLGRLIDYGYKLIQDSEVENNSFLSNFKSNKEFQNSIKKYCIGKLDGLSVFGGKGLPFPQKPLFTHLKEWAFQRVERLDILLEEPELRGPFHAESVSPNSELTIAETYTSQQFDFNENIIGRSTQRVSERTDFTSSTFRSALGNLTESGISDENSFNTESTLLNTLREKRREVIDRTLTNISRENENRTVSASLSNTSSSRTYLTRGKDPKLSTTELAFQVVSKVNAEVRLEDVNLVWAPYVYSPFMYLHQIIRNHKERSIYEYTEQNLVVDPVRPFIGYDYDSFKKEKEVRGSDNYQSKTFEYQIPAQLTGDGWELDRAGSTVDFRNGKSGDYDWLDRPNWDDLENWSTYFNRIEQQGDKIVGEATLETTDPEWLNKGFFVFNFKMRRMSEVSRTELRAYESEQAAAEAERRAVLSRSRQYGDIRMEELIERYENSLDLREEALTSLMKKVFFSNPSEELGYYKEIIRSCINWNTATMHFDSNRTNNIPFAEYGRSHFMNSPGIRFILPIIRSAEDIFFSIIKKNGVSYYESAITDIKNYTENYRTEVETLKDTNSPKLILDKYSREIVLGRHLEAVLSKHPFSE